MICTCSKYCSCQVYYDVVKNDIRDSVKKKMPIDLSSIIYFFNAYDNFCRILYVDCHVCDSFLCVLADINVITEGEPDSLLKLVLSQSSDGKLSQGSEFYVVSPEVYLVPS